VARYTAMRLVDGRTAASIVAVTHAEVSMTV
jgi:hypothetical protein